MLILFFALGGIVGRSATRSAGSGCRRRATCTSGRDPVEHFKHMALPTLALAFGRRRPRTCGCCASDMISTLQENFITTAKAKGVPDRRILWGHALRPSSFTLLTVFGLSTATLIGGALVIETIFIAARPRHA